MVKQEKVVVRGYRRPVSRSVIYCDACGRQLNWCITAKEGQFCERCFKQTDTYRKRAEVNKFNGAQ